MNIHMSDSLYIQKNKVHTHFEKVADTYALFYNGTSSEAHSFTTRLRRVCEMLPDYVGIFADLGCGPGLLMKQINLMRQNKTHHIDSIIGMDFSSNMVIHASRSCQAFSRDTSAMVVCGDVNKIPFADQSLDTVVCMGLMEYLDNENDVLREIARVTKPNATVIITLPNRFSPYRLWQRLLNRFFNHLKIQFPNSKRLTKMEFMVGPFTKGVTHREYSENAYKKLLKNMGFTTTDVCYYNFKLFITPLDKWFPKATVWLSRRLEVLTRSPVLRFCSTAFIIKTCKV